MEMKVIKDRDGWRAESEINIGEAEAHGYKGHRILKISTSKSRRGIGSYASVVLRSQGMETFVMYEDFSEHFNDVPCARVTEKSVKAAHESGLVFVNDILNKVLKQYGE